MTNAKKELIEHVGDNNVTFVNVAFKQGYDKEPKRIIGTLNNVLPLLDFEYDSGLGEQRLFGYIWYTDGTWSSRYENDGSEYWEYNKCPKKDIVVNV